MICPKKLLLATGETLRTQCLLQPTTALEAKWVSLHPIPAWTKSTAVALGSAMAWGHSECQEAAWLYDPSEDSFCWPSPPTTPCQVFTIRCGCSPALWTLTRMVLRKPFSVQRLPNSRDVCSHLIYCCVASRINPVCAASNTCLFSLL